MKKVTLNIDYLTVKYINSSKNYIIQQPTVNSYGKGTIEKIDNKTDY